MHIFFMIDFWNLEFLTLQLRYSELHIVVINKSPFSYIPTYSDSTSVSSTLSWWRISTQPSIVCPVKTPNICSTLSNVDLVATEANKEKWHVFVSFKPASYDKISLSKIYQFLKHLIRLVKGYSLDQRVNFWYEWKIDLLKQTKIINQEKYNGTPLYTIINIYGLTCINQT